MELFVRMDPGLVNGYAREYELQTYYILPHGMAGAPLGTRASCGMFPGKISEIQFEIQ